MKRFWTLGFIIVLWLVFSAPYFFKGFVPFPSDYLVSFFPPWNAEYGMPVKNNAMPDVITQIFPWKKLTIDTWKSGSIPLWNPYSFSGTPHAANYQSAVFSPVNLLFFVLPFLTAWTIMILLQPLVAGIGMYVFLRRIDRSPKGSTFGAIGFMFCSFMTTWMAYGTLGWAIAFLPWSFWAIASGSGAALAISIGISFLSGHFQISLYLLAAAIAYVIYVRKFRLLLYMLLGMFLAAPQFLLTFDAYIASTRAVGVGKIEVIPWQYVITVLIPDFFGNPVTRNDWFGHYAEWGSYVGVIPLLLGLFAVANRRKDGRLFFVFLSISAILLAFPTPFNDLLYALNIPILSTSASGRIIVLLSFALSALSAYGLDDVAAYWMSKKRMPIVWFVVLVGVGLGLLWTFLLTSNAFPADKLVIAKRNSLLPTVIAGAACILIFLGAWRRRLVRELVIGGLLVFMAFDSLRFVTKWMPVGRREYMYPPVESLAFLSSRVGNNRVFGNIGNESSGMFGLPIIEGYDAMYQGRYAEFINSAEAGLAAPGGRSVVQFGKQGKFKTHVLKLLGVKYIYHRMSDGRSVWTFPFWEYLEDGSMKIVFNDQKYQVFEFTHAYPRAFLASSYKIATDNQQILDLLFDESIDTRETLILEEKPVIEPASGSATADIISYKPTSVTVRTNSSVPKLLFLSDVYDAGWHAFIDGIKTPIYRADYDFRAVAVPEGDHIVEFYYFPKKLTYGFLLSLGALILLLYANRHVRSIS